VYQRSAPWLLPRRNEEYPDLVRRAIARVPGLQRLRRYGIAAFTELFVAGLTRVPPVGWALRAWSAAFMRAQLRDPGVRRRAWPDHPFGCKRILFSSDYLPALQRPDVELVTDAVERITPRGGYREAGSGRVVNNWPGFMTEYVRATRRLRPEEYREVRPAAAR
jgi:cation diffusion facilitator CzcD-associated flavoprotein CzcO